MREIRAMLTPPLGQHVGGRVVDEGPVNEDGVPLARANDPRALAAIVGVDPALLGG